MRNDGNYYEKKNDCDGDDKGIMSIIKMKMMKKMMRRRMVMTRKMARVMKNQDLLAR